MRPYEDEAADEERRDSRGRRDLADWAAWPTPSEMESLLSDEELRLLEEDPLVQDR
ncbi:MAG: hypothetical protein AB9880_08325 [Christensenellales bacterium]